MRNPNPVSVLKSALTALVAATVAMRLVGLVRGVLTALTVALVLPGLAFAADGEKEHQLDIPVTGLIALGLVGGFIWYLNMLTNDANDTQSNKHSKPIVIVGFLLAAAALYFTIETVSNSGISFYFWP